MKTETAHEAIRTARDLAADQALRAIDELRRELDAAAANIGDALAGKPAYDRWTPSPQRMTDVLTYGATFGALWRAAGYVDSNEEGETR